MCQNPTSLPMENRQKKCVKCPKAPKTKKNRNRTPPIMGFVRDTAIGSTAPNSPPDSGSAWRPRKQAQARPVPASPLFPNKAHAGPHLDLRSHLGSARRPQIHAERLQNKIGRHVEKRARVIFEIMTWRRIISDPGSGIPG